MCDVEHTLLLFFNGVSKIPIVNKMISAHKMIYNIFGSAKYHQPHSFFLNLKSFSIKTLVFLAEMILGWMDISWGFIETCRCKKIFNILYPLHISSVFLPITNLKNQIGIFMRISCGEGAMYFSRLYFLFWGFFAWKLVIMQVCQNYITIRELPSSALRRKYIILIFSNYSHIYHHQPIYGTCLMKKLRKKSHHQIVTLYLQTIYFLSYQSCGMKETNISIMIVL